MPRLPDTYAPRPTPQSGRGIASYDGTAVARAVQGLGQTIGQVGEEYSREQDAQSVFEARRKLDEWERAAVFDPKDGAINKRGKDAFGLGDTLAKSFDEAQGKIAGDLSSQRQRRAFQEVAASRRNQVLDWSNRHELQQREVYDAGQYEADIKSMADRAALFPDKAAGELALQAQRTIGFLRGKGRSEEEINAVIKDNASKTHAMVIGSMLNAGNGEQAAQYLKDNRGGMNADVVLRAEGALKETVAREKSQAFGDDVMKRGLTLEEGIREARAKFKGVDEDAAVNELKTRYTEAEVIKTRDLKAASDEAWKIITNGGSRKQIPSTLWNKLGGDEQRQINDYTDAKWRRAKADAEGTGNDVTPDRLKTYIGLRDMAINDPAAFTAVSLDKVAPNLTKQHLDRLIEIRSGINKNDAKAAQLGKLTLATVKDIDLTLKSVGIDMTPKDTDKKGIEKARRFKEALYGALDAADANGSLDAKKAREIGMGLLKEGFEQKSGWWLVGPTQKRAYEFESGKDYVSKQFKDIPTEDRRGLIEALAKRKNLARSMYGDRNYILSADDEAEIERKYQVGVERGVFK